MLKEIREKRQMTQSKLAKECNVSLRTIQNYESGNRNIDNANIEILVDLSNVLECKVSDILTNKELIKKVKTARF